MKNIYGYDYKKPCRDEDYAPPILTEKDEYIPKTHIGMYSIFRNPKSKNVYIEEDDCQNIRKKTFNALLDIMKKYGSPSYADLWNYNISAINDSGLNYFLTNSKIKPVGALIECFEYFGKSKEVRFHKRTFVSFAINKELLQQYFRNVEDAKKNGSDVKIPKLKPRVKKSRELVIFGQETIKIDENNVARIERNALYNRFEHWCVLQGVEKRECILMALEMLLKAFPVDGLNDADYYNVVTEFDRRIFSHKVEAGTEELTVDLSKQIFEKSMDIIARYNLDPENLSKGTMDFDTYCNNALHLLNSHMPMKYQDPELLKEQRDTEMMESEI